MQNGSTKGVKSVKINNGDNGDNGDNGADAHSTGIVLFRAGRYSKKAGSAVGIMAKNAALLNTVRGRLGISDADFGTFIQALATGHYGIETRKGVESRMEVADLICSCAPRAESVKV